MSDNPGSGTSTIERLAEQLAELLADFDHHERRVADAFQDGYRQGFESGWEVGYAHAHEEMARHWRALAERIRGYANSPTFAELERRRAQPGGAVYYQAVAHRSATRRSA